MLPTLLSSLASTTRGLRIFWRDDSAASAVEYAVVVGLGVLGAVSASRMLEHNLAHTFDSLAAILSAAHP